MNLLNTNQDFRKREKARRYRQRRTARRAATAEAAVSSGELDGWTKFTLHHYRLIHAGQQIDYWPSTQRFMIRGDVRFGNARNPFIESNSCRAWKILSRDSDSSPW